MELTQRIVIIEEHLKPKVNKNKEEKKEGFKDVSQKKRKPPKGLKGLIFKKWDRDGLSIWKQFSEVNGKKLKTLVKLDKEHYK